jgi:plasmid stability protein
MEVHEMPTLNVRDVPSGVYRALRSRARRADRSLAAEVREILAEAARQPRQPADVAAAVEEIRRRYSAGPGAADDIERFVCEDRGR